MFSVIIPCFNAPELLRRVLAGFVAQREPRPTFEIILVDNNSETSPDEVYEAYLDRLSLYLVRQPRLPHTFALCRARNVGLRLARHPWIITLDADCVPNPDYLRVLAQAVEQGSEDAIFTAERVFIDHTGADEDTILARPDCLASLPTIRSPSNYHCASDRRFPDLLSLQTSPHPWAFMHGGNTILSRRAALDVGGYDERYDGCWGYEDIDFAYRLINAGCRPSYVEGAHVYHLEWYRSSTDRQDKRRNPNWERIIATIPGFARFKAEQFQRLGAEVEL